MKEPPNRYKNLTSRNKYRSMETLTGLTAHPFHTIGDTSLKLRTWAQP
jgi:hypothetical protein